VPGARGQPQQTAQVALRYGREFKAGKEALKQRRSASTWITLAAAIHSLAPTR